MLVTGWDPEADGTPGVQGEPKSLAEIFRQFDGFDEITQANLAVGVGIENLTGKTRWSRMGSFEECLENG